MLTNSIITFTQSAGYSVGVKQQRQMESAAIEDTKKGTTAVSQGQRTVSQAVGRGRAVSRGVHTGSQVVGGEYSGTGHKL